MVGNYETTIDSLTLLIDALNNRRNFYLGMLKDTSQPAGYLKVLLREKQEFLDKLSVEYKRLTSSEYVMTLASPGINFTINSNVDSKCLESEEYLIDLYSEILNKDILWEVLPVLANHLSHLTASKELLLNKIQSRDESINVYYDDHALVN